MLVLYFKYSIKVTVYNKLLHNAQTNTKTVNVALNVAFKKL